MLRLDYYSTLEIERIIARSAEILGVEIKPEAVSRLALASRFTPRVANRLLRRARDYAEVHGKGIIEEKTVLDVLDLLEVDEVGLERIDRELLTAIVKKFGGGPVGLAALGAVLNEEVDVIESVYEPYLMSLGFLNRTRMGRVATEKGREYVEAAERSHKAEK
jgi:Holliday junction DNA helicase RuvB